jgi:F0F1-type ATP synthase assembly protein I
MTRKSLLSIVGGAFIGALVGILLPGDMMTRFLIAVCSLLLTMVLGVYFLNRSANADEDARRH